MTSLRTRIFHIAYSAETLALAPAGLEVLDNLANPRPDWFEYWPIRHYLLNERLDENTWYGFFSPRFGLKTGHDHATLTAALAAAAPGADVYFVCPQPEVGSFFANPFHGTEATDPGALATVRKVVDKAGMGFDPVTFVSDSRNTIFSNYFLARPAVWRRWLELCETVFAYAEHPDLDAALHAELNVSTSYGKGAQRKIFVIEGMATLLVAALGLRAIGLPLFAARAGAGRYHRLAAEAVACDALKIAFRETGRPEFLEGFGAASTAALKRMLSGA